MYANPLQPEAMKELYNKLPPEITELFEYDTVGVVVKEIAQAYVLNEEQVVALQMEIELVLYLLMPRHNISKRLEESLGIDEVLAQIIAGQLDDDLFLLVEPILDAADNERDGTGNEAILDLPIAKDNSSPTATTTPDTDGSPSENTLKPLRTFAMDVDWSRAHSYGSFRSEEKKEDTETDTVHRSNQDDIIKK